MTDKEQAQLTTTKKKGDSNNDDEKSEEEDKIPDHGGVKQLGIDYGHKHKWYTYPGYLFATLNGFVMPLFGVLFQELLSVLTDSVDDKGNTHIERESLKVLFYFVGMGVASFILHMLQYFFWGTYGTLVSIDVRKEYFNALVHQEISFHDEETSATMNSTLTTDTAAVENGIGVKMGFAIQQFGTFLFGMVMSFYYSWMVYNYLSLLHFPFLFLSFYFHFHFGFLSIHFCLYFVFCIFAVFCLLINCYKIVRFQNC
jgi:ABC-type multidrug transport system fused ATPase/permease subunit